MIVKHRQTSVFIAAIASALTGLIAVPTASAQGSAQDTGDNILLEAVEAAKKLDSLSATVKLSGAGALVNYVPSGTGTIRLAKDAEPINGMSWHTRVDVNNYVHLVGQDKQVINALRTPELFIYTDHQNKTVQERNLVDNGSVFNSAIDLFGIPELTGPSPFVRELREATSWEAVGRETVNGVQCDVVEIVYDMAKNETGAKSSSLIRTPESKWYFGVEDRLPRRIERVTNQSSLSFTIIADLTDVVANPGIDPASLEIETPEGYSRTVSAKRTTREAAKAKIRPADIATKKTGVAPENDAALINLLPAHGFELADEQGNPVTLDSLKGNVAVLYFWGTWCVPCKEYSPLVSDLVAAFEGEPVKVFGLPVRERNADAVREAMSKYAHTLLLNPSGKPVGADETARAYKVRRYPTVYVIGANSEILTVKWPEADVEPADMMAQVEKTIIDYLATMD